MIGNVIQSKFLRVQDYPEAAALSFILMALILVGVFAYTRVAGPRAADRGGAVTTASADAGSRPAAGAPVATGPRIPARVWDRIRTGALALWSGLALLYLFLPIFLVVLFSFNDPRAASTTRGRASRSTTGRTRSGSRGWPSGRQLAGDRADLDGDRAGAGHRDGARAGPLPLPRPRRRRPVHVPAARLARGRAGRRAARAVPDDERRHRIRDDRHSPRDVQRLLRRGDREGAARGHGPPHRGGGHGPGRQSSGRRSARSPCR